MNLIKKSSKKVIKKNNNKYLSLLDAYNRKSKDFDKVMNQKIIKFMTLLEKFTGQIKQKLNT
jgi:hypothetical protein